MAKTQVILKGTMRKDKDGYHVSADVVQPAGLKVRLSYGLGNRKSLAERAVRAIDAGVLWPNRRVEKDNKGEKYVGFDFNSIGKYLDDDLRDWGF